MISREDSKGLLISRWRYQVSASRLPLWASRSEYGTASEGIYVRNSAVYLLASLSQRTIQLTFERFRLHCLRLRDMPKGMPRLIGLICKSRAISYFNPKAPTRESAASRLAQILTSVTSFRNSASESRGHVLARPSPLLPGLLEVSKASRILPTKGREWLFGYLNHNYTAQHGLST